MKEDKMTDRGFEMVSASDPTDQFHRVRIRCSHKGCTATMIFSRRGVINPVHAAKWFRDKGWHVSGHKNADLCPEHTKGGESMKRVPKLIPAIGGAGKVWVEEVNDLDSNENPAQTFDTLTEPVASVSPVMMTRTEKRIIYAKLEEVYADETTGYRGNWTDEKVAVDLGIPKEWVSLVREDAFGPEYTQDLFIQIDAKLDEYLTSASLVEEMKKDYDRLVAEMDQRLADFDLKASEVTALAIKYTSLIKDLEKKNG